MTEASRWARRLVLLLAACTQPEGSGPPAGNERLVLATTTSVRDAGLLEAILPEFERRTGYTVSVVAVGSGQAMELGRRGEADILILHDPVGETEFVADGFGIERGPLMHNSFLIVGPRDDPADIRGHGPLEALRRIAAAEPTFVSRGDRSGTHVRELRLWAASGARWGAGWYRETGQGMGATLVVADQLGAYTLTDLGTFLGHRAPLGLVVLVEGDTVLHNPYHVIVANPERFPHTNPEGARALASYLLDADTQRRIGEFRRRDFGRSLFVPGVLASAELR